MTEDFEKGKAWVEATARTAAAALGLEINSMTWQFIPGTGDLRYRLEIAPKRKDGGAALLFERDKLMFVSTDPDIRTEFRYQILHDFKTLLPPQ